MGFDRIEVVRFTTWLVLTSELLVGDARYNRIPAAYKFVFLSGLTSAGDYLFLCPLFLAHRPQCPRLAPKLPFQQEVLPRQT